MYLDRTLPAALHGLMLPNGPLQWLSGWLGSPSGHTSLAHLQFRRSTGKYQHGAIQLYFGRTSPLCAIGTTPSGAVCFSAHASYQQGGATWWNQPQSGAALAALQGPLQQFLTQLALQVAPVWLNGEAILHAGFMRRYGFQGRPEDRFGALDSEVKIGFASRPARQQVYAQLLQALGLGATARVHSELDVLALESTGALLLVEMKAEPKDLAEAARQVAMHVWLFSELARRRPTLAPTLQELARQKRAAGLLEAVAPTSIAVQAPVPVIAAPDDREDWFVRWQQMVAPARQQCAPWLDWLRFWRLSATGEVVEERGA